MLPVIKVLLENNGTVRHVRRLPQLHVDALQRPAQVPSRVHSRRGNIIKMVPG